MPRRKSSRSMKLSSGSLLDDMPNPDQLFVAGKLLQLRRQFRRPEIHPPHHAADKFVPRRQIQQPARLFKTLPNLDGDASVKFDAGKQRLQIARHKIAS